MRVESSRKQLVAAAAPCRFVAILALLVGLGCRSGEPGSGRAHAAAEEGGGGGHGHDDHGHGGHGHGEGEHGAEGHGEERHDEVTLSEQAMKRYGITLERVEKHSLASRFTASGKVSFNAERMAHVGSPVSGRVAELKVRVGDFVKKGDVLLVVESPELAEAQSDYRAKRATAVAARGSYERAKGLYEKAQGVSLGELQKREAEFKAAEVAAAAAEDKLKLYGLTNQTLESLAKSGDIDPRFAIAAPIPGQVVEREATLGELVGPDRESLLVLADTSTLWIMADVPESRMQEVALGSRAKVRLPALRSVTIDGTVSFIAPAINESTRTAGVRIEVKDPAPVIKPGMFAQVEIAGGPHADEATELAVPEGAVQTVEGAPAVFVAVEGEENTFAKRPVAIAPAVGGLVPILSGLEPGELVVTSGSFILKADLGKEGAEHEH